MEYIGRNSLMSSIVSTTALFAFPSWSAAAACLDKTCPFPYLSLNQSSGLHYVQLRVFHCPSRVCPPNPNFYCYWTSNLLADSHTTIPPLLLLNFPTPSLSTAIGSFLVFWNESFVLPCAFWYSQIIFTVFLFLNCFLPRVGGWREEEVQKTILFRELSV